MFSLSEYCVINMMGLRGTCWGSDIQTSNHMWSKLWHGPGGGTGRRGPANVFTALYYLSTAVGCHCGVWWLSIWTLNNVLSNSGNGVTPDMGPEPHLQEETRALWHQDHSDESSQSGEEAHQDEQSPAVHLELRTQGEAPTWNDIPQPQSHREWKRKSQKSNFTSKIKASHTDNIKTDFTV